MWKGPLLALDPVTFNSRGIKICNSISRWPFGAKDSNLARPRFPGLNFSHLHRCSLLLSRSAAVLIGARVSKFNPAACQFYPSSDRSLDRRRRGASGDTRLRG